MTSIEALLQVPGTQLQTIEPTLRQLMTDLKNSNITPPADLDALIEEAAIAHAEDMAYYNGMTDDMPEYYDDQLYEEYLDEAAESYAEYERYCYEQMTLSPADEEYLAKQMLGEIPIKNGNKLSVVNELYLMGYHLSENFKTLYPKAWEIFCYYRDML